MPKRKNLKIAIMAYDAVSIGFVLLIRDVFKIANMVLESDFYELEIISYKQRHVGDGEVSLQAKAPGKAYDYIIVPPATDFKPSFLNNYEKEGRLLQAYRDKGSVIVSSCLGSLIVAQAGLLDGASATTHWAWLDFAKQKFPEVQWNIQKMICETSEFITAGGYLAAIDLLLSIIGRSSGKNVAQKVGKIILAETIRESQSIFSMKLVLPGKAGSGFENLEAWVENNLRRDIQVNDMAEFSLMSLRTFQRKFSEAFGISPQRYLQIKRVEKAKQLLSDQSLSLEEILERVGLGDPSAFRKVFKREIGLSPSEFRRRSIS
ncbi:MAG: hypothetical protein OM95_05055 [Bdellovibrio sp. ArHS]|uniref:GlxA family transcriptional regulator n=1 Tax=Bdellovibrio sp. ArHS TaxID=1569284 RepID=UPI000583D2BC|nr:helix-turn-helix domain-containing protein [Bdellovibrio sp. ArHS]KHD89186.1 MAG: hypothetical protein OM95_05055 [Bdellovibrio sp. ArHS]